MVVRVRGRRHFASQERSAVAIGAGSSAPDLCHPIRVRVRAGSSAPDLCHPIRVRVRVRVRVRGWEQCARPLPRRSR
jgi:hypothetical protein